MPKLDFILYLINFTMTSLENGTGFNVIMHIMTFSLLKNLARFTMDVDSLSDSILSWFRKTQGNIGKFADLGFKDPQSDASFTIFNQWNNSLSENATAVPTIQDTNASLMKDSMIFVTIAALYCVIGLVIFFMDRMCRKPAQEPDEEQKIDRGPEDGERKYLTRHWLQAEEKKADKGDGQSPCPTPEMSGESDTGHSWNCTDDPEKTVP